MLHTRFFLLAISFMFSVAIYGCKKDACEGIACQHGGTCTDGKCVCINQYTGERCEQLANSSVIGEFVATYTACGSIGNTQVIIERTDSANRYLMTNLGDYACANQQSTHLSVQLSDAALTLPSQTVCVSPDFEGYTFSGSGAVGDSGKITLNFTVSYKVAGATKSDACQAVLRRK